MISIRPQTLAASVTPRLQQAEQLNAEIARLQANAALVDNRINSLSLESNAPGAEHIVSPASPPTSQVSKHLGLFASVVLIAGMIAAFFVAILLDAMDPNIYTAAQIRALLGFSQSARC